MKEKVPGLQPVKYITIKEVSQGFLTEFINSPQQLPDISKPGL